MYEKTILKYLSIAVSVVFLTETIAFSAPAEMSQKKSERKSCLSSESEFLKGNMSGVAGAVIGLPKDQVRKGLRTSPRTAPNKPQKNRLTTISPKKTRQGFSTIGLMMAMLAVAVIALPALLVIALLTYFNPAKADEGERKIIPSAEILTEIGPQGVNYSSGRADLSLRLRRDNRLSIKFGASRLADWGAIYDNDIFWLYQENGDLIEAFTDLNLNTSQEQLQINETFEHWAKWGVLSYKINNFEVIGGTIIPMVPMLTDDGENYTLQSDGLKLYAGAKYSLNGNRSSRNLRWNYDLSAGLFYVGGVSPERFYDEGALDDTRLRFDSDLLWKSRIGFWSQVDVGFQPYLNQATDLYSNYGDLLNRENGETISADEVTGRVVGDMLYYQYYRDAIGIFLINSETGETPETIADVVDLTNGTDGIEVGIKQGMQFVILGPDLVRAGLGPTLHGRLWWAKAGPEIFARMEKRMSICADGDINFCDPVTGEVMDVDSYGWDLVPGMRPYIAAGANVDLGRHNSLSVTGELRGGSELLLAQPPAYDFGLRWDVWTRYGAAGISAGVGNEVGGYPVSREPQFKVGVDVKAGRNNGDTKGGLKQNGALLLPFLGAGGLGKSRYSALRKIGFVFQAAKSKIRKLFLLVLMTVFTSACSLYQKEPVNHSETIEITEQNGYVEEDGPSPLTSVNGGDVDPNCEISNNVALIRGNNNPLRCAPGVPFTVGFAYYDEVFVSQLTGEDTGDSGEGAGGEIVYYANSPNRVQVISRENIFTSALVSWDEGEYGRVEMGNLTEAFDEKGVELFPPFTVQITNEGEGGLEVNGLLEVRTELAGEPKSASDLTNLSLDNYDHAKVAPIGDGNLGEYDPYAGDTTITATSKSSRGSDELGIVVEVLDGSYDLVQGLKVNLNGEMSDGSRPIRYFVKLYCDEESKYLCGESTTMPFAVVDSGDSSYIEVSPAVAENWAWGVNPWGFTENSYVYMGAINKIEIWVEGYDGKKVERVGVQGIFGTGSNESTGQMGKRAHVEKVDYDAEGVPVGFFTDSGASDSLAKVDSGEVRKTLADISVSEIVSAITDGFDFGLAYVYDGLLSDLKDLFGFVWNDKGVGNKPFLALHGSMKDEPVAVFHEICEYLVKIGGLSIEISGDMLIIRKGDFVRTINVSDAMKNLREDGEDWVDDAAKLANNHYKIRILQRHLFKNADKEFTHLIKAIQYAANGEFIELQKLSAKYPKEKRLKEYTNNALQNMLLNEQLHMLNGKVQFSDESQLDDIATRLVGEKYNEEDVVVIRYSYASMDFARALMRAVLKRGAQVRPYLYDPELERTIGDTDRELSVSYYYEEGTGAIEISGIGESYGFIPASGDKEVFREDNKLIQIRVPNQSDICSAYGIHTEKPLGYVAAEKDYIEGYMTVVGEALEQGADLLGVIANYHSKGRKTPESSLGVAANPKKLKDKNTKLEAELIYNNKEVPFSKAVLRKIARGFLDTVDIPRGATLLLRIYPNVVPMAVIVAKMAIQKGFKVNYVIEDMYAYREIALKTRTDRLSDMTEAGGMLKQSLVAGGVLSFNVIQPTEGYWENVQTTKKRAVMRCYADPSHSYLRKCRLDRRKTANMTTLPTMKGVAREYGISPDDPIALKAEAVRYAEAYVKSCARDWSAIDRGLERLSELAGAADEIIITGDNGTNLTISKMLSWPNKRGFISDRGSNFPHGEVYGEPSIMRGTIVYPETLVTLPGGAELALKNIEFTIDVDENSGNPFSFVKSFRFTDKDDAGLSSARAHEIGWHRRFLQEYFEQNLGASRIGEFAIGTAGGLEPMKFNNLLYEKMAGIHIAIGNGFISPPIAGVKHIDMVRQGVNVYFVTKGVKVKILGADNKFVHEDLQMFNLPVAEDAEPCHEEDARGRLVGGAV